MKIAVFLPNWLGDLVMATPVLRAMRRHFGPDAQLVGVVRPYLQQVLDGTHWLDELWGYDRRSGDRGLRMKGVARRMRQERFDLAVLLTNSLSSAILAWRGGARQRVGYVRYGRGLLLTTKLYPRRRRGRIVPEPMVDSYLALAAAIGCPTESRRLELAITPAEERLADETFVELGLRTDGRVIALNSSGAYGAAKLWPAEYFAALARRIVERLDHDVLVLCGPNEREIARSIARQCGSPRVFSMAEQAVSIPRAKACIRRSRMMVSTDSGPRHVAAALDKPVLTLLGPTSPVWIENPTQRALNLTAEEVECLGCQRRVCPLRHHQCMRNLTPERVFAAVARMIDEQESAKAA
jgi:heptosyltransferase-2